MVDPPMTGESAERLTREKARQQTRDRLLDAAAAVFRRLGYDGASLDEIAETAGYTKGAIYSNFDSKADLFKALVDRYREAERAVQTRQFAGQSLEQVLDKLDEVFERQVEADPGWIALQIEFMLVARRDPEVRRRILEGAEERRARIGASIDAALAKANRTAAFTGRELILLIKAIGTGLALQQMLEPEAVDARLFVRAARELAGMGEAEGE